MMAFADESIRGIISTIGGDDSIRIPPYLNARIIKTNPKVFLGYSDTTVAHLACYGAGLTTFYGPSLMAGFAENTGMFPYMVSSVRRALFSTEPIGDVGPNMDGWTVEHLDWADPSNQQRRRQLQASTGDREARFRSHAGSHSETHLAVRDLGHAESGGNTLVHESDESPRIEPMRRRVAFPNEKTNVESHMFPCANAGLLRHWFDS